MAASSVALCSGQTEPRHSCCQHEGKAQGRDGPTSLASIIQLMGQDSLWDPGVGFCQRVMWVLHLTELPRKAGFAAVGCLWRYHEKHEHFCLHRCSAAFLPGWTVLSVAQECWMPQQVGIIRDGRPAPLTSVVPLLHGWGEGERGVSYLLVSGLRDLPFLMKLVQSTLKCEGREGSFDKTWYLLSSYLFSPRVSYPCCSWMKNKNKK